MNSGRPPHETLRLRALQELELLDTPAQASFNDAAQMAATVCGMPIALVSLVDGERLRFKARVGLDLAETPAEHGFCTRAIQNPAEVLVVPDTRLDPQFDLNPLVCGAAQVRFYAGATIVTDEGRAVGTVCVLDRCPRQLTPDQLKALQLLARQLGERFSERAAQHRRRVSAGVSGDEEADLNLLMSMATQSLDLKSFIDRDYVIRTANDRWLSYWGTSRERLEGLRLPDMMGWPSFERDFKPLLDRTLAGETIEFTRVFDYPGVGPRMMEVAYVPAFVGGEVAGVVVRSHDIEKLNLAQRELETALQELSARNQRQQQFIYMVSHDLREPVNAIHNFSSLLLEDGTVPLASAQDRMRYLGFIRDGSQRMRTMLDDLLDFVRLDATLPTLEPVDLSHLMQQVQDDLSDTVTRSGAQVEYAVAGAVMGVESQLRVLFQNLVSNAVKFSKKGQTARVRVNASTAGARVEVRISDHGIGIPQSHMPKLFGLFKRHTSIDDYPGTGLGLAICRRIVDRHRGDISVHSREGEGTSVHVTLASASAANLAHGGG